MEAGSGETEEDEGEGRGKMSTTQIEACQLSKPYEDFISGNSSAKGVIGQISQRYPQSFCYVIHRLLTWKNGLSTLDIAYRIWLDASFFAKRE